MAKRVAKKPATSNQFSGDKMRQKHLAGKHDQLTHGYRFGKAPTPSKARRMRDQGTWGEYVRRARERQGGLSKAEQRRGKKVEAAQGRIRKAQEKYAKAVGAEHKAGQARERASQSYLKSYALWEKSQARVEKTREARQVSWDRLMNYEKKYLAKGGNYSDMFRESKYKKLKEVNERARNTEEKTWKKHQERQRILDDSWDRNNRLAGVHKAKKEALKESESSYLKATDADRKLVMMEKRREAARVRNKMVREMTDSQNKITSIQNQMDKLKDRYIDRVNNENDPVKQDKMMNDWDSQHKALYDKLQTQKARQVSARASLYQTDTSKLEPKYNLNGDPTTSHINSWDHGAIEFSKLAGSNPLIEKAPPQIGFMDSDGMPYKSNEDRGRSYHLRGNVYMSRNARSSTVVHELGHALEYRDPAIARERRKWVNTRTRNETEKRLKDLFPNSGYDDNEVTKPDRFLMNYRDKSSGPYTGKVYGHGSSEVLSMGLQLFYDDPVGFAKSDPDFFDFTYAVVRMGL